MAVYSELIKNFEKIREYVRDFYIFGFHTRESFDAKSKRTYDNEAQDRKLAFRPRSHLFGGSQKESICAGGFGQHFSKPTVSVLSFKDLYGQ